jgi:ribosomal protein L22
MLNIFKKIQSKNLTNFKGFKLNMFKYSNFCEINKPFINKDTITPNFSSKPKLKIKTFQEEISFLPQNDVPFFVKKETSLKKTKKGSTTIRTGDLHYSGYKLNEACRLIRGKYIRTAIVILENQKTKGAKLVLKELKDYLDRRVKEFRKWERRYKVRKSMQEIEKKRIEKDLQMEKEEFIINENQQSQNQETNKETKSINEKDDSEKPISQGPDFIIQPSRQIESNELSNKIPKIDENSEEPENMKYFDYLISEAFVGRKKGQSLPNPRAKGKMDMVTRSLSRLFIRIEKVNAAQQFEEAVIGKADQSLAVQIRKQLFMCNASIKTLSQFSFITTSKGRSERKYQFTRVVRHLREKFYKEKGVKINLEIIREELKKHLGKELSIYNPNNLKKILTTPVSETSDKEIQDRVDKLLAEKEKDKFIDKSYRARENLFETNYKKFE